MQYLFRFFSWLQFSIKFVPSLRRLEAGGEQVSNEFFLFIFFVFLCREAFIWTCLGIVSGVHSGLALPLLTVSIREGFEWTEVEPPARCVLQRRKTWSAEGRHSDRRRETDRQEEREGKGDKDAEQQNRELIYRFTCVHGWISLSSLAGTSRCVSSSAWLIDMTHLLGCTRLLGPTDCEKLRYPNERTR